MRYCVYSNDILDRTVFIIVVVKKKSSETMIQLKSTLQVWTVSLLVDKGPKFPIEAFVFSD